MTFAEVLRSAMTARGYTIVALARQTGLQDDGISKLRRGQRRPTLKTAAILAEALDWGELTLIAARDRRRRCIVCRKRYISAAKYPERGRYCGQRCQQTDHARRRRGREHDITAARLRDAQAAVAAFCLGCEPVTRQCRDSGCALRPLSPLPFLPLSKVRAA